MYILQRKIQKSTFSLHSNGGLVLTNFYFQNVCKILTNWRKTILTNQYLYLLSIFSNMDRIIPGHWCVGRCRSCRSLSRTHWPQVHGHSDRYSSHYKLVADSDRIQCCHALFGKVYCWYAFFFNSTAHNHKYISLNNIIWKQKATNQQP